VLVTIVAAFKENCFQELSKTVKTVRISKFIWQRVPDCWAGVTECLTAVRAESIVRHSETVRIGQFNQSINQLEIFITATIAIAIF